MCVVLLIILASLVSQNVVGDTIASCEDIDPVACQSMAQQNANMCQDPTLARQVCPKHCNKCPLVCYSGETSIDPRTNVIDFRQSNTISCNTGEICRLKPHGTGIGSYIAECGDQQHCTHYDICCNSSLCNTPKALTTLPPTTTTTTTTPKPTTTTVKQGTKCLVCDEQVSPTDCGTVITCGNHEQCFIETYVTVGGHLRYNLGCRDALQCSQLNQQDRAMKTNSSDYVLVCVQCCNGTLCNSAGCGHQGYTTSRGPVCYNCLNQMSVDDCETISVCGRDEVCLINRLPNDVSHELRYHTRCELNSVCQHQLNKWPQVQNQNNLNVNSCVIDCCTEDLCNSKCNNSITSTTHCHSNPCAHGRCSESHNTYTCTCDTGYTGRNCDTAITMPDNCHDVTCKNGGQCYDSVHVGAHCRCKPQYSGPFCESSRQCDSPGNVTKFVLDRLPHIAYKFHFTLVKERLTQRNAYTYCQKHCLGRLLRIQASFKHQIMIHFLNSQINKFTMDLWIDGRWNDIENRWENMEHNTTLLHISNHAWSSTNWSAHKPCVHFEYDNDNQTFRLVNQSCGARHQFICEYGL